MEDRLARLERQVRRIRMYAAAVTLGIAVLLVAGASGPSPESDVIRVKGIIVEDSLGRERILIGAPIPPAANRVRTDSARVARIWGPRFPPEYLDWYQDYRHEMNGMLVLDPSGFDRLAVGDGVPDPNIGKRIGRSTGVIINDSLGFERSGYGLLSVDGEDRVVLGLDRGGAESVTLMVDDEGRAGLFAGQGSRRLVLGAMPSEEVGLAGEEPFFGLMVRDGEQTRIVNAADAPR